MKYLKVKPEANQKIYNKSWQLISGELYTIKEVEKMDFSTHEKSKYFSLIECSKFNTYFSFGARFIKPFINL